MSSFSTLGQKLAIVAVCLSLGACATYERAKPAPAVAGPITVKVNSEQLSGWSDLPVGAYKVPESDVIITGHQRGQAAGMMFGLLGVAIAHAANSNASSAGVSNTERVLRMKLTDQTRAEIEKLVAQQPLAAKFTAQGGGTQLDVSSALLLSYVNDTQVRSFSVLKVVLTGADKRPLWETRYFASSGEAKPLEGAGSWTDNGGEPLKAAVATNLRQAVKVMLNDVAQPYSRDDKQMTVVEASFPYIKQRVQMKGYSLTEDENYIAFVPKIGDAMVLSGVNVLDKSVIVYRPAKPDDVVFKLVPETPAAKTAAAPATAATPSSVATRQ